MDDGIEAQADDSTAPSPPLPVVVGDIEYLYRKDPNYDRDLDEIDWENLLFDDSEMPHPDGYAYDSRDYATEGEASKALEDLLTQWTEEAIDEARASHPDDESRQARL